MEQVQLFDVLIIGAGPAGLAAVMALGRACRTVAVFDSQRYRNERASMMHNIVCHDGVKPDLYRTTAMREITDKYDTITFIDAEIVAVDHITNGKRPFFRLTSQRGLVWDGLKLILATGIEDILPAIEGYKELWGRGIVHCLFCDGYEKRGGHVGVLGLHSPHDLDSALLAFPLAKDGVTIFTGNGQTTTEYSREALGIAMARGAKVDSRTIKSISEHPDGVGLQLNFDEGGPKHVRMLLSSPPSVNRAATLIKSLGLEVHEGGQVLMKTAMGGTSIRGCFMAGDTISAAKIAPVALASGSLAGIGAAKELAHDDAAEKIRNAKSAVQEQGRL